MSKNNNATPDESMPNATVFSLEQLRKDCTALFGVSVCAFDGATHKMQGAHTKDAVKNRIADWLKTPVFKKKEVK